MSFAALISIAASVGAPLVESILARKIGSAGAGLVRDVVDQIAKNAGLTTDQVTAPQADQIDRIATAITDVESIAPEMIHLYERELEAKQASFAAEREEALWVRAWRPLGMYGLGLLWMWNVMLLHIANAIWKIALPPMDFSVLLQLSALYMSLYMGGHTVKAVMAR